MKARVKATGEIVEIEEYSKYSECGWKYRDIDTGILYKARDLDFSAEAVIDYWTRLEHQYAGMAMQGILSNPNIVYKDISTETICNHVVERIKEIAHALVEKYKKEEK